MNLAEVKKLKVAELRAELQQRGLDTKGLKADLVARLTASIEAESPPALQREVGDGDGPPPEDEVQQEEQNDRAQGLSTPAGGIVTRTSVEAPVGPEEVTYLEDAAGDSEELLRVCESAGLSQTEQSTSAKKMPFAEQGKGHAALPRLSLERIDSPSAVTSTSLSQSVPSESSAAAKSSVGQAPSPSLSPVTVFRPAESVTSPFSTSTTAETDLGKPKPQTQRNTEQQSPQRVAEGPSDQDPGIPVAPTKIDLPRSETQDQTLSTVTCKQGATVEDKQAKSASVFVSKGKLEIKNDDLNGSTRVQSQAGSASDNGAEQDWSMAAERGSDVETGSEPDKEESKRSEAEGKNGGEHKGVKRPRAERARGYYEFKEEINYNRAKSPEPVPGVEDEKEVDSELVQLDSYNCDLHFEVGQDGFSGQPMFSKKFPLLWSGCRLTHGFKEGNVGFEAKFEKKLSESHSNAEGPGTHALRVGWSLDNSSFQLGEDELSYGYDGRGKKVTGGKEEEFGESFSEGDVIGCYASSADGEMKFSFHKNGSPVGTAFSVSLALLAGRALHPHVFCWNARVSLNLDPSGSPWFPGPSGHTPFPVLPPELRVRAPLPPVSKQQCEVLMMVGMPGAGKTHWAQAHKAENPEKRYNILSTHTVLSSMKNLSEAEEKEQMIQQATQCVSQLIKVAASRRRNYILDQTNVYHSAQKWKLQLFKGFQRRAVVICPTDEEWKRRLAAHQEQYGEEVPDSCLLKVKVSFTLPQQGDYLEEVLFPEMSREETEKLLTGYKEEARRLLPSPPKRKKPRHDRKIRPPSNAPSHSRHGHDHKDWRYGGPRGGYNQRPYGQRPYWGPPRREDYRPFYGQYRMEHDPFYGRNYDPQRYREYHRQYTGGWNRSFQDQGYHGNRNYGYGSYRGYR
ncbi:hypothetical protein GJAV_G00257210 [Gymnothorax javanicus]|nr:hypothetical protein GJAV_G00257210 [Gymnothorax javanicus]